MFNRHVVTNQILGTFPIILCINKYKAWHPYIVPHIIPNNIPGGSKRGFLPLFSLFEKLLVDLPNTALNNSMVKFAQNSAGIAIPFNVITHASYQSLIIGYFFFVFLIFDTKL